MTTVYDVVPGAEELDDVLILPGLEDLAAAEQSSQDPRGRAVRRLETERRARARARRCRAERARAQRRVRAGQFAAHPGWRRRRVRFLPRHDGRGRLVRGADPVIDPAPAGQLVIVDQAWALMRIEERVDAETLWRSDRRAGAMAVLAALAHGMDWSTGLVAGLTRAQLARAAGCSVRTVSRVLAWASSPEVGLVACVEPGASAEHLGTETNRAAAYAFVAPSDARRPGDPSPQLYGAVDEPGNPPASCVTRSSPRSDQGQKRLDKNPESEPWGLWDRPRTPPERAGATHRLLERTGLSSRVARWRAIGLLSRWWSDERVCVAGLLHALDHHPDQPDQPRGDALRGARDPLAVLAARLAPWQGRLHELPHHLHAVDPDQRRRRAHQTLVPDISVPRTHRPTSSPTVRAAARRAATPRRR